MYEYRKTTFRTYVQHASDQLVVKSRNKKCSKSSKNKFKISY
uniref:Uncharacterized protein n=1 Tax=Anguilla anguilla TaxID=7936 RepID=A0A0E9WAD4_ANGAN